MWAAVQYTSGGVRNLVFFILGKDYNFVAKKMITFKKFY